VAAAAEGKRVLEVNKSVVRLAHRQHRKPQQPVISPTTTRPV
jgi:hypothetical protein